jgi:NAD(P)-dependent dehydrogenase (short-subunit alcohol dehydrogenase family)
MLPRKLRVDQRLAALLIGIILSTVDSSALNLAMPSLATEFRSDAAATRALVEAKGRRFFSSIVDVTSPTETLQFAAQVEQALGPLSALVNNAGIYPWKSFEETDFVVWRKVIGVNLDGTRQSTTTFRSSRQSLG